VGGVPATAVLERWRTSARVLSGGGEVEGGEPEGRRRGGPPESPWGATRAAAARGGGAPVTQMISFCLYNVFLNLTFFVP